MVKAPDRSANGGLIRVPTVEIHRKEGALTRLPDVLDPSTLAWVVVAIDGPFKESLRAWVVKQPEGDFVLHIPSKEQLEELLKATKFTLAQVFERRNQHVPGPRDPKGNIVDDWYLFWCYENRRSECGKLPDFESIEEMVAHMWKKPKKNTTTTVHSLNESSTTANRAAAAPVPVVASPKKPSKRDASPVREPELSLKRKKKPAEPAESATPPPSKKEKRKTPEEPARPATPPPTPVKKEKKRKTPEEPPKAVEPKKVKNEQQSPLSKAYFVAKKLADILNKWKQDKPAAFLVKIMAKLDAIEQKDNPLAEVYDLAWLESDHEKITPEMIGVWLNIMLCIELQHPGTMLTSTPATKPTFPSLVCPPFGGGTTYKEIKRNIKTFKRAHEAALEEYVKEIERIQKEFAQPTLPTDSMSCEKLAEFVVKGASRSFICFWNATGIEVQDIGKWLGEHPDIFYPLLLRYVRHTSKEESAEAEDSEALDLD